MAKKNIIKKLRIEKIIGGEATPSSPLGPVLGSSGINLMEFCKQFNLRTQDRKGELCPVVIIIYEDKSFVFIVKKPPVSIQLLEKTNIKKGSKESNKLKVAKISLEDIKSIAENKLSDFNCFTLKSAISMVKGTARSMGIEIKN